MVVTGTVVLERKVLDDAGGGEGRKVGGMVETEAEEGRGTTTDEDGAWAAPRLARPKTAKIVETFIFKCLCVVLGRRRSDCCVVVVSGK